MKVAIMQPYVFPYIGYFQLINAVDKFVFYDDVNFIKKGWINRNRILINGTDGLFTVPCKKVSQNKLIKDVEVDYTNKEYLNILPKIYLSYKKAKYFKEVFPICERILSTNFISVSELSIQSVKSVCNYLELDTEFFVSSESFSESRGLEKSNRLIDICMKLDSNWYINAEGGAIIYTKDHFLSRGIMLNFLKPKPIEYSQFGKDFVPWLSIIDVLMFNGVKEVKVILDEFELI